MSWNLIEFSADHKPVPGIKPESKFDACQVLYNDILKNHVFPII